MGVLLKQGVLHNGLHRETRRAIGSLATLYAGHGLDLIITSLMEGEHMSGSLHYDGKAIDFRRQGLKKGDIATRLYTLSAHWQVIEYNDLGIFHVEWDN